MNSMNKLYGNLNRVSDNLNNCGILLNNQVKLRPVCVGCGKTFEITNGDYDFYIKKGFDIPKRCPTCRANKKSSSSNFNPYSVPTPSPSTTPATKRKGSICFITTAVCAYLGKPDDCDELNKLRNFRDTWLTREERPLMMN